jgi:hypothetical protein
MMRPQPTTLVYTAVYTYADAARLLAQFTRQTLLPPRVVGLLDPTDPGLVRLCIWFPLPTPDAAALLFQRLELEVRAWRDVSPAPCWATGTALRRLLAIDTYSSQSGAQL